MKAPALLLGGILLTGFLAATLSHRASSERVRWPTPGNLCVSDRDKPDSITETGTLLWQGKPFFPIGIYQVNHTDAEYRMLAQNGFNMIQGRFPGSLDTFMESLDLA